MPGEDETEGLRRAMNEVPVFILALSYHTFNYIANQFCVLLTEISRLVD